MQLTTALAPRTEAMAVATAAIIFRTILILFMFIIFSFFHFYIFLASLLSRALTSCLFAVAKVYLFSLRSGEMPQPGQILNEIHIT